jgi:hypothetical protein
MRRRAVAGMFVFAALASAVAADAPRPAVVDVPCAEALAAPPRVAADADGRLLVALPLAGGVDVVAARPDAADFGDAVHAVRRSDLILGGRRGPRIAVAGKTVVLAAITRRERDRTGGDLLAWRSADGGASWSDAVRVNDVATSAEEGLFDLAALADGRFAVVWLDDRAKGKRVRADFSADGAAWGEDVLAYESPAGTVCECCAPAIAAADGGAVIAFRNLVDGDRDVWTMRLAAGAVKFGAATKSGEGSWKLAGCPMAGPAVAVKDADVVAAWRREKDVFLAAGGAKERDLGEGTEPQVVVADGGVHVLWIAKEALVHLAPGADGSVEIAKTAAFPCAAGRGGAVVWLDTATRRARLTIVR